MNATSKPVQQPIIGWYCEGTGAPPPWASRLTEVDMRNPITVTVPFVAPAGKCGAVSLIHDRKRDHMAHLSIAVATHAATPMACAPLTVRQMQQLVDGLVDCIQAIERNIRLENKDL
jgi:hypothetical protein